MVPTPGFRTEDHSKWHQLEPISQTRGSGMATEMEIGKKEMPTERLIRSGALVKGDQKKVHQNQ